MVIGEDGSESLITIAIMKITAVFAPTLLTSLLLAPAQESDQGNAVLQTERDLATAYLKSDAPSHRG
jgi:hypothetical protein